MPDEVLPFRRQLLLSRPTPSTAVAALEDHMHHVVVTVEHREGRVSMVMGQGVRLPWSLCPGAVAQLDELVGAEIGTTPMVADAASHCTHLLDCASAAVRFARADAQERRYDLSVTDWHTDVVTALATRDDGIELQVQTDGATILQPQAWRGRSLKHGFSHWATETLDPDLAELAILLRRAIYMRYSMAMDLDDFDVLSESGLPPGSCFASQPERIHIARRNRGTSVRMPADWLPCAERRSEEGEGDQRHVRGS